MREHKEIANVETTRQCVVKKLRAKALQGLDNNETVESISSVLKRTHTLMVSCVVL
jgi:hypothetical protein